MPCHLMHFPRPTAVIIMRCRACSSSFDLFPDDDELLKTGLCPICYEDYMRGLTAEPVLRLSRPALFTMAVSGIAFGCFIYIAVRLFQWL